MLKSIKEISNIQLLNKNQQKAIKGGIGCFQNLGICCLRITLAVEICGPGICSNDGMRCENG